MTIFAWTRKVSLLAAGFIAGLFAAVAVAQDAPPPAPPGYYQMQKVVYQSNGGFPDNKTNFQSVLRHIGAHLAATNGKVEIRVVSFGAGVQSFLASREDPELAKMIADLRAKGVRFLFCRNTMMHMKITAADIPGAKDEDVVPSGVAEIARLQGLGFVYIRI